MFARMMHKHILVFFNDVFWCTRRDNDFSKCDAILVYRGKCSYLNTVPLSDKEYDQRKQYFEGVRNHWIATQQDRENRQSTWSNFFASPCEENCTLHKNPKDCIVLDNSPKAFCAKNSTVHKNK